MSFENVDYNEMNEDEISELAMQYEFREEYEKAAELLAKASERGDLLSGNYLKRRKI